MSTVIAERGARRQGDSPPPTCWLTSLGSCCWSRSACGQVRPNLVEFAGNQQHWRVPDIEYVLWAILFGLLVTNTVGVHRIFRPGVQTYEFWLKIGIVALGVRFVLGDVVKLGGISLVQILVDMALAGGIILAAAHFFGLSGKLGSLLAIGTSICGYRPSSLPKARSGPAIPTSVTPSRRSSRSVLSRYSRCRCWPVIGLTDHEFGLWQAFRSTTPPRPPRPATCSPSKPARSQCWSSRPATR